MLRVASLETKALVLAALIGGGATLGTLGVSAAIRARIKAAPVATPVAEPATETGRKLFLQSCAHCHGDDARGDDGPDLHNLRIGDAHIALLVTNGIKGDMPSFAKKHDAADIAALTAYLRTLR